MTKVEINYLNEIKKHIAYDEIFNLLMRLIQLMTIDQKNGKEHSNGSFITPSFGDDRRYSIVKIDNELTAAKYRTRGMFLDKLLQIHFNLWPIDAVENAKWGSVNIKIAISEHASIILSKRFEWISDLKTAKSLQVSDLKGIEPVLVINYDKDHFRVFDLVTENFVGNQGGNANINLSDGEVVIDNYALLSDGENNISLKPTDEDDSSKENMGNKNASIGASEDSEIVPFLQEIDDIRGLLVSGEITEYLFDINELAYLVASAADCFIEYGKKSNSSDRRIRKFIGLFPSGKNN